MKKLLVISTIIAMLAAPVFACTCFAVGKAATVDGSTIISHNDDSSGADFRLWLIPGGTHAEGEQRELVMDSHNYADFETWYTEGAEKDYGNGVLVDYIPEAPETYSYFHSRYSFMNSKGVAMGETTMSYNRKTEMGAKSYNALFAGGTPIVDCWMAQDLALERATTAREAVEIIAALIDEFGWHDAGESLNICDGDEVWIMECYGAKMYCAFRLPDDAIWVGANRATIDHVEWDNPDWIYSPNMYEWSVEQGIYSGAKEDFSPEDVFNPDFTSTGCQLREWAGFMNANPGLNLDPYENKYPLYVTPDRKLSVQDILEFSSDYYKGTQFDASAYIYAGPYGDPTATQYKYRPTNMYCTCYIQIANVKAWLPDEAKCLVWFGYGAPDTTYLTPLWASMYEIPEFYRTGSRYENFRRDSGWWVNSYLQTMAKFNYQDAVKIIHQKRAEKLDPLYTTVAEIQEVAGRLVLEGKTEVARQLLTTFGCQTATEWHNEWRDLADYFVGRYNWGLTDRKRPAYTKYYQSIINNAPDPFAAN